MSPFEIIMLVCFGMAWPFSIYKSYTTRGVGSKSLLFLVALLIGYLAGVLHKISFLFDGGSSSTFSTVLWSRSISPCIFVTASITSGQVLTRPDNAAAGRR